MRTEFGVGFLAGAGAGMEVGHFVGVEVVLVFAAELIVRAVGIAKVA